MLMLYIFLVLLGRSAVVAWWKVTSAVMFCSKKKPLGKYWVLQTVQSKYDFLIKLDFILWRSTKNKTEPFSQPGGSLTPLLFILAALHTPSFDFCQFSSACFWNGHRWNTTAHSLVSCFLYSVWGLLTYIHMVAGVNSLFFISFLQSNITLCEYTNT